MQLRFTKPRELGDFISSGSGFGYRFDPKLSSRAPGIILVSRGRFWPLGVEGSASFPNDCTCRGLPEKPWTAGLNRSYRLLAYLAG